MMHGTGEARKENVLVDAFHEKHPFYRFEGTRHKGDRDIYTYRPIKYLTNLKNHFRVNLERFMICAVFALYPGLSRNAKWTMMNGITNDRNYGNEIEFVGEKASNESASEASVIRAVIEEHRAVLWLANPSDKISELKKDKERYYRLVLRYFVFLDRELERKAEMKLIEEKNEEWERRKAILMGKRFNVVLMSNIKSHFVTIDSGVLHGIMQEISPEFNDSMDDFTGENRETYWKSNFQYKRLKVSKQKVFTGMIESDGVALCVHYRRLKKDRPVPFSAAPVTKDEEMEETGRATQKVQDNVFLVDAAKVERRRRRNLRRRRWRITTSSLA